MRRVCVIGLVLSMSTMAAFSYVGQAALAQEHNAEPRSEIPHEMPADRAPDAPSGPSEDFGLGGPPQVSLEELLASEAKNAQESSTEQQKNKAQVEAPREAPADGAAPENKAQAEAPREAPAEAAPLENKAQAEAPQEAPADGAAQKNKAQAPPVSSESKTAEKADKVNKTSNRLADEKSASAETPSSAEAPSSASDRSIAKKETAPPARDQQAADVKPVSHDQPPAAAKASFDDLPRTDTPSSDRSKQSADGEATPDEKAASDGKTTPEEWVKSGPLPKQPYQWVRLLEKVQNQIVTGNRSAHLVQRRLIAEIGDELIKAPDSAWKDPRNARAVVTYVLSGGDPRAMVRLMKKGEAVTGISDVLLKGLFAYAKGENREALELLSTLSARDFHPGFGGQLALAQATLMAKRDARKALAYLDEARLLSPGTLVEEAALRRTVPLAIGLKDFDRLVLTMSRYLRRFDQSVYASTFHWNFARGIALCQRAKEEKYLKELSREIDLLNIEHKKTIYKVLAEQGLTNGNLKLAHLATEKMAVLSSDEPSVMLKAQLYEAAVLLFGEKYDYAVSVLKSIDAKKLNSRDRDILKATLVVANRLREPVPENVADNLPKASAAQGKYAEMAVMSPVIKAGRTAIAKADELLNGTRP